MHAPDLAAADADAHYILGHTATERRRLREQAAFMNDLTHRFLVDAGLRPGMRVLDVGSGFGDVSLLAASVVGAQGAVVGIEREPAAVAQATARVAELDVRNVSFVTGDLREVQLDRPFDAVIGRFVLMYLANPVAAVAAAARHLRPGGIVAFQEWHGADRFLSVPPVPLWLRTGEVLVETFRRAGTNIDIGMALRECFVAAGLPSPSLRAERIVGGGETFAGYAYLTGVIRSIVSMIEHYGVATADDLAVDTLERRLREEVIRRHATVAFSAIVSAWCRAHD